MQLLTLYRRRLRLLAGNPRELIVPLATPVLFAIVIGPALKKALGSFNPRVDYLTFVSIATVVLLVPLNAMFSGLSVMGDREHGALRELLAPPVPRWFPPFANILPGTPALALMRHGLTGGPADGLKAIWGANAGSADALASFAIVAAFTVALLFVSARVFRRSAVA